MNWGHFEHDNTYQGLWLMFGNVQEMWDDSPAVIKSDENLDRLCTFWTCQHKNNARWPILGNIQERWAHITWRKRTGLGSTVRTCTQWSRGVSGCGETTLWSCTHTYKARGRCWECTSDIGSFMLFMETVCCTVNCSALLQTKTLSLVDNMCLHCRTCVCQTVYLGQFMWVWALGFSLDKCDGMWRVTGQQRYSAGWGSAYQRLEEILRW